MVRLEAVKHGQLRTSLVTLAAAKSCAAHILAFLTKGLVVALQEVAFMTANRDSLTNGLLASLEYQKDVSAVKLTEQTKVRAVDKPLPLSSHPPPSATVLRCQARVQGCKLPLASKKCAGQPRQRGSHSQFG